MTNIVIVLMIMITTIKSHSYYNLHHPIMVSVFLDRQVLTLKRGVCMHGGTVLPPLRVDGGLLRSRSTQSGSPTHLLFKSDGDLLRSRSTLFDFQADTKGLVKNKQK